MAQGSIPQSPLAVKLVGEIDHPDFIDAVERIRTDATVVTDGQLFELVVIAQSRPGAISEPFVRSLRKAAPLAGLVGLMGSWCEGETRTGKPWPDVLRLYWHEFPAWWYLQLKRRAAGLCPEWARLGNLGLRMPDGEFQPTSFCALRNPSHGVIALRTHRREAADVLATAFREAGFTTLWYGPQSNDFTVRGLLAGVWDGGQLDARESDDLAAFCRALSRDAAPVVALLDFPRRDSLDLAIQCGAATVLGKPWRNDELLATVEMMAVQFEEKRAA
jgi:hypothetical protein